LSRIIWSSFAVSTTVGHDGTQGVPRIDARTGGGRLLHALCQRAYREREAGPDAECRGEQQRRRDRRARCDPEDARLIHDGGEIGKRVHPDEREGGEQRGSDLGEREPERRALPGARQRRCDGAPDRDADQEAAEHRREGVDARAEHLFEEAKPQVLVREGRDARQECDGENDASPSGQGDRRSG
jgi:hypothetical protein